MNRSHAAAPQGSACTAPAALGPQRYRRAERAQASALRSSLVWRLRQQLTGISKVLGRDQFAVLVAERLTIGHRQYGELRFDTDRRDLRREALEEAADLVVYTTAAFIRRAGARRSASKPAHQKGHIS